MFRTASVGAALVLFAVGCGASSNDARADEANLTEPNVTGDAAERLLSSFEVAGGVDHASGGARGVRASNVLCIERGNHALGENHPLFGIPTVECSYAAAGYTHPFALNDAPGAATLLFDALAAAVPTAVGSEPGSRSHVEVTSLDCSGTGLGTGNETSDAPPFVASCELTVAGGNGPARFEGEVAQRIVRALHHAKTLEKANDGSVGTSLRLVGCVKNGHGPLGESDPMQGIATTSCELQAHGQSVKIDDPIPHARALFVALEKAGVQSSSGSGKTGVSADSVYCYEGNGQPASCSVQ